MVNHYPDYPGTHLSLAAYHMAVDNASEAIATCENAFHIDAIGPGLLAICSYALNMTGKNEEAIAVLKKDISLRHSPTQAGQAMLFCHLAESYRKSGRYKEAIAAAKKVVDSKTNNNHLLRAYITLVCTYSSLGMEKKSNEAVAKVLHINPDFSLQKQAQLDSYAGLTFWDYFLNDKADRDLIENALDKVRQEK